MSICRETVMGLLRPVFAVLLSAAAIAAAPPGAAAATTVYDGLWSVLVITDSGTCDRAYRYPVRIAGGRVGHAHPSNTSFTIAGRVGRGGSLRVSVSRGDRRAEGTGRLTRNSGGGKWRSARGECSGKWTAERRPE
jgi:hypothetical protein